MDPVSSPPAAPSPKSSPKLLFIAFSLILLILVAVGALIFLLNKKDITVPLPGVKTSDSKITLQKFASVEEMKEYLHSGQPSYNVFTGIGSGRAADTFNLAAPTVGLEATSKAPVGLGAGETPDRYSTTNVQVKGIDEPDIVKTDGKNLYVSSQNFGLYDTVRPMPMGLENSSSGISEKIGIYPPLPQPSGKTALLTAFPLDSLAKNSDASLSGELLLSKENLIIQNYQSLTGFNVSDKKAPKESWKMILDPGVSIVASRLYKDKIYLVTKTYSDFGNPCPLPILNGVASIIIPCTEIYRPNVPMTVDSVFTILLINPTDGKVEQKTSFVGNGGQSVVYMSEKALFLSFSFTKDYSEIFYQFLAEKGEGLVPAQVIQKIQNLQKMDLSTQAKATELQVLISRWQATLSSDERLRVETEMQNRMKDFSKNHFREFESTGIARVSLDNLGVSSIGNVPGHPLNQFSLDEFEEHLRIATTVGGSFGFGGAESENDLYILDKSLKETGSVKGLGQGERIYSVRLVADRGYVVTFKQTDPFYVLDLADPKNPAKKGELKIPGFSSYLDPLSKDRILGIGQETGKVKLSLFDVADATNPTEKDKYSLDEYYSEVQNNHHAFLHDEKHKIFFLPGSKGGYIFSYNGDKFELKKAVASLQAKRALFIEDYLYVIGEGKLVVLNESDWTEVKSLSF